MTKFVLTLHLDNEVLNANQIVRSDVPIELYTFSLNSGTC